jgi:hypothetical protein
MRTGRDPGHFSPGQSPLKKGTRLKPCFHPGE